MRFASKTVRFLFILVICLTILAPLKMDEVYAAHICSHPAPEQIYGRNANCGYFLNNSWNGGAPYTGSGEGLLTNIGDNLPGNFTAMEGVTNVNQFVSLVRYHLNVDGGCNPASGSAIDQQRRNAASFLVLTMQGAPAGTVANGPCVIGQYSFARWESLVRQYDAAGLVEWNPNNNIMNGWYTRNTRIQGGAPDVAWYVDPNCVLPNNPLQFCAVPSIVFRAPNLAPLYMIKKNCANPIDIPGVLTPLTHGFNVNPTASVTFSPTDDAPTSATFATGASYSGSPSITTYDRKYYYIKAGTTTEVTLQDPPPATRTNTGTSATFTPVTLSLVGLGLDAGDRVCARNTVTPAAGTADPSGDVITVTVASRSANTCEMIVHVPYHQVFGDTRVGSGFLTDAGSCAAATDTSARIIGHNRDGTPDYTGAGSQLAAYAFNSIAFFASGQLRPSVTTNAKPLSFANVNPSRSNLGASDYGGGLMDGQSVCAPDHYDDGIADADQVLGGSTSANIPAATYRRTGDLTITGGNLGLGSGSRVIYVDGDVTINNNITYAVGNYNNIDQIPSFRLIVTGNIYVDWNVSQLDGIYIAQPHDSGGTEGRFYTCAPGGAPPDAGEMNGICRTNKLTIYGAVLADLVKLTRSGGTVSQATNVPGQTPSAAAAASTAAEVIVLTPESWLVSDFTGGGEFDSVTTLPPVL